ncbi:uncharacterized protein LOC136041910 isoform X2 [Artemia franciscana]|uniref:Tudor domain-containing protein n=1 Tax=Artemia franciscana TaxID=6661 RepID=A0AA88H2Y7_ARTSF|nr:hypothetical protein QYM36_018160 [Artemia franciscana]
MGTDIINKKEALFTHLDCLAHIRKRLDQLLREILNNIKSLVLDVILEKEEGTLVIKQKRVRQIIYDWCDHLCSVVDDFADSDRTSDPSNDEDYGIDVNLQELPHKDLKKIFIDHFSNVRYYANLLRKCAKRLHEKCEGYVCSILSTSGKDPLSFLNMLPEVDSLCKSSHCKLTESYNLICGSHLFQVLRQTAAISVTPLENCSKRDEQVEPSTNSEMDLKSSLSIPRPAEIELQSSSFSVDQSLRSGNQDLHESMLVDGMISRSRQHPLSIQETQQKTAVSSPIAAANGSDLNIQNGDKFFSASTKGFGSKNSNKDTLIAKKIIATDSYVGKTFRVVVEEVRTPEKFYLSFASNEHNLSEQRKSIDASSVHNPIQMKNSSQGIRSKTGVVCCRLHQLKPVDGEWSKYACLYFRYAVEAPGLLVAVFMGVKLDNSELIYSVKLWKLDIEPRKGSYDIGQYLVETRFAVETEEASQSNKKTANFPLENKSKSKRKSADFSCDIQSYPKMPSDLGNDDSFSLNHHLNVNVTQKAVEALEHDFKGPEIEPVAKPDSYCSRGIVQLDENLSDVTPSSNERLLPEKISQLLQKKEGTATQDSKSSVAWPDVHFPTPEVHSFKNSIHDVPLYNDKDIHNESLPSGKVLQTVLGQRKKVTEQLNSPAAGSKKSHNAPAVLNAIKEGSFNALHVKTDSCKNSVFSGSSWSNKDLANLTKLANKVTGWSNKVIPEKVHEVNLPTPQSQLFEVPDVDYLSKESLSQMHIDHPPCFPNMSETSAPLVSFPPDSNERFPLKNGLTISTPPPRYFLLPVLYNLPANPKQVPPRAGSTLSQSLGPVQYPLGYPYMPSPMPLRFNNTNAYPQNIVYSMHPPQIRYFFPHPPLQSPGVLGPFYQNQHSNPRQVDTIHNPEPLITFFGNCVQGNSSFSSVPDYGMRVPQGQMYPVQSDNSKEDCKESCVQTFETRKILEVRRNPNKFSTSSQNQDAIHKTAGNTCVNPGQSKKNMVLSNSNRRSNLGANEGIVKPDTTICRMEDKGTENKDDAESQCHKISILKKGDSKSQNDNFEEMQDFYSTKARDFERPPEIGKLVACQEENDGIWYRGEVLDIDKDFAQERKGDF